MSLEKLAHLATRQSRSSVFKSRLVGSNSSGRVTGFADECRLCGRSERHAGVVGRQCFAPAISCSALELGRLKLRMKADESSTIAVLAEKPSVARDIARVLGADKRGEGYLQKRLCRHLGDWTFGFLGATARDQS